MALAEAEMPASPLRSRVLCALSTLIYLHYGSLWVAAAAWVATVVGRRAFGLVEGSPVLSAAYSAILYSLISAVVLFPVAIVLMAARVVRSVSNDDTHAEAEKDIKEPLKTPGQIARKVLKDPFMIGVLLLMPSFMLIIAGQLVVGQPPVKGSSREQIGSILMDVGILGSGAALCFLVLPTLMLRQWRMKLRGDAVVLLRHDTEEKV